MNKQTLKEFCYTQLKMTNNPLFLSFKWNVCRNERHLKQNSSAGSSTKFFWFFPLFLWLCSPGNNVWIFKQSWSLMFWDRIMFLHTLNCGFCNNKRWNRLIFRSTYYKGMDYHHLWLWMPNFLDISPDCLHFSSLSK